MSKENVEIVKRAEPSGVDMVQLFRGEAAPDPAASGIDVTAFDSDFEAEFISAGGSMRPTSHGPEALAEAWRDWLEAWESYYLEVEDVLDAGDEVVSLVRVRARTARDAVAVEHRPAAVWWVRKGKIARVRFYLDRDQALEAAGLREQASYTRDTARAMSQENVEVVKRAIARTSTNWTAARLVRVRVFFDRQEALEAAGLQEQSIARVLVGVASALMGAVIELHPLDDRGKAIIDQVEKRTGHQPTELHPPDGTHVYILEADDSGADAFDQVLRVIDENWREHVSRTPETF